MKLRGKKVGDAKEMEAKWALLSGKYAKGRMEGKFVNGRATVVVTPEGNRTPMTISAYYPDSIEGVTAFGLSASKEGKELFSYDGKLKW